MKPYFYIPPSEKIRVIMEMPEEPNVDNFKAMTDDGWVQNLPDYLAYLSAREEYEAALASAKESSILCADQEQAERILWQLGAPKENNTIHPIPEEYDVTIMDAIIARMFALGNAHKRMPTDGQVAVITPKPSPSIPMNYAQRAIRDERGNVISFEPFDKHRLKAACKDAKNEAKALTNEILFDSKKALDGSPSIERQEELWTKVIFESRWYDGTPYMLVKIRDYLMKRFTIARKKD